MGANTRDPFEKSSIPEEFWMSNRQIREIPLLGSMWTFDTEKPEIATSSDGRVMLIENNAQIILPFPAAQILADIEVRRACRV